MDPIVYDFLKNKIWGPLKIQCDSKCDQNRPYGAEDLEILASLSSSKPLVETPGCTRARPKRPGLHLKRFGIDFNAPQA